MIDNLFNELISAHDKYRFEIKLALDRNKFEKANKIEYYFFLPSSLNISHYTYDKTKFYASLQRYIRYQTPDITIEMLFEGSNSISPYIRTIEGLDKLKNNSLDNFLLESIVDEMKLIGTIIKNGINESYSSIMSSSSKEEFEASSRHILMISEIVEDGLNRLKKKIFSFNFNRRIFESFKYLDDYVTLLEEETLLNILKKFQVYDKTEVYEKIRNKAVAINSYRDIEKYIKLSYNNIDYFLYYRGLLKKFISSCLFLKAEPTFNLYTHIVSGVASGLAMLFAVLITVYVQMRYSSTSKFFIITAVIIYIFKDRIKEFVKVVFSKHGSNFIFDRKIKITEPTHNIKIGYIKESFSILSVDRIDDELIKLRNRDNLDMIDEDAKMEVVLKYKTFIKLYYDRILKYHTRRKNPLNIIRFSIFDFLKHTDDESVDYNVMDNGSIKSIMAKKTYHMNVIIKYISDSAVYERYRIIFNRSGIMKVNKVI
ncbi:MAG: hypothetical protein KA059_05840 [Elusimicrobiales bacterium]|nr:hypothetical protein [Elusimicrobiales bacterium]